MTFKSIVGAALMAACASSTVPPPISAATQAVLPGVETFLADVPDALCGKRVGLITNHTGIDRFKTSDIDLIARHKDLELVALLAPEHGIRGTPTAAKHGGLTIPAIRFRVTDRETYRPVRTSLLLIDEIRRRHPADFAWTATIDRLTGSDKVKLAIEAGRLGPLLDEWDREAAAFRESSTPYLLY